LESFVSPAAGRERLDQESTALERILLESRISTGMSIKDLKELKPNTDKAISQLIADGLVMGEAAITGQLILTLRGRLLADAVVRALTN